MFKNFQNKNYSRWMFQAVGGILVLQSGLCMVIEAAFYKHSGVATWQWLVAGTIALSIFYAGLALTVDSLRFRMKWLAEKETQKG